MRHKDIVEAIDILDKGGVVHGDYFDIVRETISPFSGLDANRILNNLWFVEKMVYRSGQSIDKDHLYLEGDAKLLLMNQMKSVDQVIKIREP